ncbi:MAG: Crp/Fnr family transcriptional regulator [bacterium]
MGKTDIYDLSVEWDKRDEGSDELLDAVPTELIEEGDVLYQQGNKPVEFSLVRHGKVEVAKQAPDGSKSILEILGPGEPVGAMAVINNFPYPATVKALQDTIVYRFSADLVEDIQQQAPIWWSDCLGTAAERITDLADRLESINTQDIAQRLSAQLCDLAEDYGKRNDGIKIDTKLTRQMLADMIGCRVESAIRKMSEWEKKGIIQTEESFITLKKPQKLYSLADRSPPQDF